jgi:putative DNA primase/helicase
LPDVYATLTTRDDFPEALKHELIHRWLLSLVAAAMMLGFHCRGVLTLQGAQGIGKTSWFRRLVNDPILREDLLLLGHHLDVANKDSLTTAICHWIVELGELDSSFKRDVARLKGFITATQDKVRRPYGRTDSEYPRRTVFCASVNEDTFLVDPTGNTRFWTLPVVAIDYNHDIDMQQVFAQLAVELEAGANWWLSPEMERLLTEQNSHHTASSIVEEKVLAALDMELPDSDWGYKSASEMLEVAGIHHPQNAQARECGAVLRRLFGQPKKIQGTMKWRVPVRPRVFTTL